MPRPLKEKMLAPGAGASVGMASFAAWFRSRLRGLKTQLINKVPRLLKEVAPWAGAWMAVVALANLLRDLNIQLMGMAVAWLVLILLQCVLGPMRRYSEHCLVQYGAMAGYYLHFPLALRAISRITSTREERAREFAVYMEKEANLQGSNFFHGNANDSLDLDRCKYPIMLNARHPRFGNMKVIKRVMDVRGHFRINRDRPVPDIFLSYSFFQLLARRYFGLYMYCAEEGNQKVRDFALKELMQQGYKRAFTVVEAQLAFLHDEFFFTGRWNFLSDINAFQVAPALMLFAILTLQIWRESTLSSPIPITVYTYYALISILPGCVFCFCELGLWMASDWYTIGIAIRTGYLFTSPLMNINWKTSWFRQLYWKNKIGQYSLIQDYDSCSAKKMSQFLLKSIIISREWPASFINKHYPVEEAALALSEPHGDSVRELVARTLQGINGPPTNGINSLHRNRVRIMDDLSWTCRQRTDTHTILIWHIATCYIEIGSEETSTDYKVATALSRYCAYLVAFDPEFIPQDKLKPTHTVFQDVLKEAKRHLPMDQETRRIWKYLQKVKGFLGLRKEMSQEKKIKMQGLDLPPETMRMSTFEKGVWLGRQLERLEDTSLRWEVMAEFWAETILYIAPSDNVALHFEHLAKGGEFVTHLWAMLSNAGILQQARSQREEQMNPQEPGA